MMLKKQVGSLSMTEAEQGNRLTREHLVMEELKSGMMKEEYFEKVVAAGRESVKERSRVGDWKVHRQKEGDQSRA